MIHEAKGRRAEAAAQYQRVLDGNARAGVAANNLAWIRIEEGRLDDAVRLASIAADVLKGRPEPFDTLGWAYYHQGLTTRAIAAFERALALAPNNPTYHYHQGLAYLKAGDTPRGRAALERSVELKPDAPSAADARRVLAETLGDR
jgi:tetratricopeptide (TPR) repeat protein